MAMHFDGALLVAEEIHRFPNIPVQVGDVLFWDALRLFSEIQAGIQKGKSLNPASLGIDTWGVDFGLLGMDGQLLGNPVHYRDQRTKGMMDFVFERIPREDIFSQTGIQFMQINTLYQLASLVHNNSAQLTSAHTFLTIPDLFNYWLTGVKACEFTNATTTQLFNPTTGDWAWDVLREVGIPERIFPQVIQPGTRLGEYDSISVIAPACHDTGSAVAAIPTRTTNSAYISSGT
jgi:rhamnulokinase